jgi:RNA recognition motif-containing protein
VFPVEEIVMNTNRLVIRNLDHLTTAEHLENLFATYGDVNKVTVKKKRGLGYVEMMSASEAKRVRENLDGSTIWGRSMSIHGMNDSLHDRLSYLFGRMF